MNELDTTLRHRRSGDNSMRCISGINPGWLVWLILAGVLWLAVGTSTWAYRSKERTPRFYLKFKAMGTTADGGDYGDFIDRTQTGLIELNTLPGYTISMDKPSYFQGFGGEFGFETGRFAIGFSGGFIEKTFSVDYSEMNAETGYETSYLWDYKLTAVPLFLFIHYKLIDTRFLSFFLTLGEGVYLTTYREDRSQTYKNYTLSYANSYIESKKNTLGFHFGATIDFKITRNIALFVEAGYRIVKLDELEASSFYEDDLNKNVETEGDFYYWLNDRTESGRLEIGPPDETKVNWEGMPAEFNLNGFSLSVGLKIIFGGGKKKGPVKIAPLD